jgi:hypothetical protein
MHHCRQHDANIRLIDVQCVKVPQPATVAAQTRSIVKPARDRKHRLVVDRDSQNRGSEIFGWTGSGSWKIVKRVVGQVIQYGGHFMLLEGLVVVAVPLRLLHPVMYVMFPRANKGTGF